MEMFLTLVLQVVLALVVAKLTLAGSRSQKWWERKADLYAQLIEKLYDIQNWGLNWLDDCETGHVTLSAAQETKRAGEETTLNERTKKAEEEVEKLTHIGTFLISKNVHDDLLAFKKARRAAETKHHHQDFHAIAESIWDAAKQCIESVREHAKDDLGLNSRLGQFKQKVRALLSE